MEAGAAELLAGKDSVCSAEGSRTEPDPDRAPEEDAAPPDELSAFGTLATLFAAGAFCCCHSASSSPATPGDVLMPSSMPGAVLDGLRTASRSCFSSLRTVRTAHTPAAAAASRGAEVTAPAAGKVVETGTDDKWGPVVAIEDASGRIWRVCGTTDAKVKKGDTVSAGQTIGKVGSVSCECAEESHIHLEVMEGEKYLDPIKAMK